MSLLLDKGHFARVLRTEEGKDLLEIQARRFAGKGLPRELEQVWNVVQIFNFLIAYVYHDLGRVDPVFNLEYVPTITEKCEGYRHLCYNNRTTHLDQICFSSLTETQEFLASKRSPAGMLGAVGMMMPLVTCADVDHACWRTGVVPHMTCARFQSVFYCRPEHQK